MTDALFDAHEKTLIVPRLRVETELYNAIMCAVLYATCQVSNARVTLDEGTVYVEVEFHVDPTIGDLHSVHKAVEQVVPLGAVVQVTWRRP